MARQDVTECTPNVLQAIAPCVACLSRKELMALMVVILSVFTEYSLPDDLDEILDDSACFSCQSDRERLNGMVATLVNIFRDDYTMDQLREEIKCVNCLNETQLKSILAMFWCQYFNLFPD